MVTTTIAIFVLLFATMLGVIATLIVLKIWHFRISSTENPFYQESDDSKGAPEDIISESVNDDDNKLHTHKKKSIN